MRGALDTVWEALLAFATAYGLRVLGAIVLVVVGWLAASWITNSLGRALRRAPKGRIDPTLERYSLKVVRVAVLAVTAIAVLANFGVQTASVIALAGAAAVTVGLALQNTLSNVAAGIVLLVVRPFRVGERVEVAGVQGTVEEIGLFATELHTAEGASVVIPNGLAWGSKITNWTRRPHQRIELRLPTAYGDDTSRAVSLVREAIAADKRILEEPVPTVKVAELADHAVVLQVRAWTREQHAEDVKLELLAWVYERFAAAGLALSLAARQARPERSVSGGSPTAAA